MQKNDPTMLSTKEFSNQTGLSVSAITKMLRMGQISGEKRSGRWMIPEEQLQRKVIVNLCSPSSPSPKQSSDSKVISIKTIPAEKDYSISEFSEKTYLTEFGIKEWLRLGKIKGHQNEKGQWRIDAVNLDRPNLQHLVRK